MPRNFSVLSIAVLLAASTSARAQEPAREPAGSNPPPPVKLTAQQDHKRMMDQLKISSLRPGPSGRPNSPNAANYDESKSNPYPNLPDPLVLKSGEKVTTAESWGKRRRPEIVEDVDGEIYGRVPKDTPRGNWEVTGKTEEKVGDGELREGPGRSRRWARLNPDQQGLHAWWPFLGDGLNGGLAQYFYNHTDSSVPALAGLFEAAGCGPMAATLEQASELKEGYEDLNDFDGTIAYRATVDERGAVDTVAFTGRSTYSIGTADRYPPMIEQLRFEPGRIGGQAVRCRVVVMVHHTFVEAASGR